MADAAELEQRLDALADAAMALLELAYRDIPSSRWRRPLSDHERQLVETWYRARAAVERARGTVPHEPVGDEWPRGNPREPVGDE